jgi:hypothetical protein
MLSFMLYKYNRKIIIVAKINKITVIVTLLFQSPVNDTNDYVFHEVFYFNFDKNLTNFVHKCHSYFDRNQPLNYQ